jgi:hypothetical protein
LVHAPRGFARRLDGRHQQAHQHANDGNHDQQLGQRKAAAAALKPPRLS